MVSVINTKGQSEDGTIRYGHVLYAAVINGVVDFNTAGKVHDTSITSICVACLGQRAVRLPDFTSLVV